MMILKLHLDFRIIHFKILFLQIFLKKEGVKEIIFKFLI